LTISRHANGVRADAILLDLGVSSMQLDRPERGFSYRSPGPLDMRMDAGGSNEAGRDPDRPTAADVVNTYPQDDLARVIFEYGGDRNSRRIAAAVVRARNRAPTPPTSPLTDRSSGATIPSSAMVRSSTRLRCGSGKLSSLRSSLDMRGTLLRPPTFIAAQ
jgi:16S rRNA (cytosine1402-N4)-methyltransferase